MGRPEDAPVTADVGRAEICEAHVQCCRRPRVDFQARKGQYVLGLRATNCLTGEVLDDEQVQAARKKKECLEGPWVRSPVSSETKGRRIAGHHQRGTPLPLIEATTSSFEAWKTV